MRRSLTTAAFIPRALLMGWSALWFAACASHHLSEGTAGAGTTRIRAVTNQRLPAGRPNLPRQFTPVAETDWSIDQPFVGHAIPCRDGKILVFRCHNTELLSFIPVDSLGDGIVRDVWGWTDSLTGREFAIVARSGGPRGRGTLFIEITDPLNPRYLGELPGYGQDMKVYKNHAFTLARSSEAIGVGVVDLTQLRTRTSAPVTFQTTARYENVESAHNIVVNEATGFMYLAWGGQGGETCGGGLHMVDVRHPARPTFAGCYNDSRTAGRRGGIHDAQCVVYRGPDQRYHGRELCFNAAVATLSIADVTDKTQPKTINIVTYPNVVFTHQGWLSEDQRYFFLMDEFDEGALAKQHGWPKDSMRSRTIVFDLADLHDPVVVTQFFGAPNTVDHNLYIRGPYGYQSDYYGGLRILDVRDPEHLKEIGYFFHPPKSESWGNYPYFTNNADIVAFALHEQGFVLLRYRAPT